MCARMKHLPKNMLDYKVPQYVEGRGGVHNRQILFKPDADADFCIGFWNGSARVENLATTWKDWKKTTIPCASIFEQGEEFPLKPGARLLGIYRKIGGRYVVMVVTRPAMTPEEGKIHSRWPVQLVKRADGTILSLPFVGQTLLEE